MTIWSNRAILWENAATRALSVAPRVHYQLQNSAGLPTVESLPAQFVDYIADGKPVPVGEVERGQMVSNGPASSTPPAYVMEPEVLAEVPPGEMADWSGDVFPKLLKRGAPLFGYISDGYWEDVGTHESYLKAQADVLARRVQSDIAGFEVSPGVWVAEGGQVDADAVLTGPLCIGDYAKIEAGAHLREYTVIGSNAQRG